jgi:hypothetical protein
MFVVNASEFLVFGNRYLSIFGLSILLMLGLSVLPIEAKSLSHLDQKIEEHVMLVSDFVPAEEGPCSGISFSGKDFFRVFPDGTESSTPFRVPSGQNLVITDVEWSVFNQFFQTGFNVSLSIFIGNFEGPRVFHSFVTVDANNGRAAKSEYSTAGFIVGEGEFVCPTSSLIHPDGNVTMTIADVILRGYLIKVE